MEQIEFQKLRAKEKGRNLAKLMEIDLSEQRLVCTSAQAQLRWRLVNRSPVQKLLCLASAEARF